MEYTAFERIFGPIVLHERTDIAGGIVAWAASRMSGGAAGTQPADFLPVWDEQLRIGQSSEQMIGFMRDLQSRGKKKKGKGKRA
jgi:hypothetical protein